MSNLTLSVAGRFLEYLRKDKYNISFEQVRLARAKLFYLIGEHFNTEDIIKYLIGLLEAKPVFKEIHDFTQFGDKVIAYSFTHYVPGYQHNSFKREHNLYVKFAFDDTDDCVRIYSYH